MDDFSPFVRFILRLYRWWDRRYGTQILESGPWGERWAARLLKAHGCKILGMNVRPCRHGEVDIIARKGQVILFVEVKTRKHDYYGRPLDAVNWRKRELMRRCATHWLSKKRLLNVKTLYRFDAIEVLGDPKCFDIPQMNWVKQLDMTDTPAPDLI